MITLDLTPNEQMIIERESQNQGLSITQYIKTKLFSDILSKSTPNAQTLQAIRELENGQGVKFDNINDLMADLNA